MPNDLRLPYGVEAADTDTTANALPPRWIVHQTGKIEFRRQPLPWQARFTFDPDNGNSLIVPTRIRAFDLYKAIPCILGWAESEGGPNGRFLRRRLPIRDENGLGMVATKILSARLQGSSRIKPGSQATGASGLIEGAWRVPGSITSQNESIFHDHIDPDPQTSEFFKFMRTAGANEYQAGFPIDNFSGSKVTVFSQVKYAILDIQYSHPRYYLWDDTTTYSLGSNPYGDERFRYCWAAFAGGAEYVTSKSLTLDFGPGAVDANGLALAGQPCATESGVPRNTGELLVHLEKVPAASVALLFAKFSNNRYGRVNASAFTVNLFGTAMTFAAETLIFNHCRTGEPKFQPHGFQWYDLVYSFSFRAGGWNNFITNQNPTPQPVVRSIGGSKPFQTTDFAQLFRFDGA